MWTTPLGSSLLLLLVCLLMIAWLVAIIVCAVSAFMLWRRDPMRELLGQHQVKMPRPSAGVNCYEPLVELLERNYAADAERAHAAIPGVKAERADKVDVKRTVAETPAVKVGADIKVAAAYDADDEEAARSPVVHGGDGEVLVQVGIHRTLKFDGSPREFVDFALPTKAPAPSQSASSKNHVGDIPIKSSSSPHYASPTGSRASSSGSYSARASSRNQTPGPDAYCHQVPRVKRRVLREFASVPATTNMHVRRELSQSSMRSLYDRRRPAQLDGANLDGEVPSIGEWLPCGHLPRSTEQMARAFDNYGTPDSWDGEGGSQHEGRHESACQGWGDCRQLPERPAGRRFRCGDQVVGTAAREARARAEEEADARRLRRAAKAWAEAAHDTHTHDMQRRRNDKLRSLAYLAQCQADSQRAVHRKPPTLSQHSTNRHARSPGPAYYQPEIWTGPVRC